jgi:serpin B
MKMLAWKKIRLAATAVIVLLMTGVGIHYAIAGESAPGTPATPQNGPSAGNPILETEKIPGNELLPFSVNLYKQIEKGKNAFYSPISVLEAFGMLQAGARGETATEMAQAFGVSQDEMPGYMEKIGAYLADRNDKPYTLTLANSFWVQNKFPLSEDYLKIAKEQYLASGFNCNFAGNPEEERAKINKWTSDRTSGKIPDLIPSGLIDPSTQLVLTNAVYFKADWTYQFKEENTLDGKFTLENGDVVQTKMMSQTVRGSGYFQDEKAMAMSLPYKGNAITFVAIVPREGRLSEFEKNLTATQLSKILGGIVHGGGVNVSLPKFKLESDYNLIPLMRNLGVKKVFSDANLSGLTAPIPNSLYVSKAIHKAYLEVDEKGSEAAAATAIIMKPGGAGAPTPSFTADRPFLFLIQDKKTHAVLFMGRVMDPRG